MSKLEIALHQLDYTLNHAMKTLDKAILLIPDDKLDWKPAEDAISAGELGIHVYMGTLAHFVGALWGSFSDEDFSIIPFDPKKDVKTASDIVKYGGKVKAYIKDKLHILTEDDMNKIVTFHCWGDFKFGSYESLVCNLEETIHHRGQLCAYLRMLGIKPPFIYDLSTTLKDAIGEIWEIYSSSVVAKDINRWLSLWSDNGIQMPPDAPPNIGKKEISAFTKNLMESMPVSEMVINLEEVRETSEWGFSRGNYWFVTQSPKGDSVKVTGKFLTVFEKQEDGSWKIVRDIFNFNAPS